MPEHAVYLGREWNIEHDRRAAVSDAELCYAVVGDGEPVLFIHGTNIADSLITPLRIRVFEELRERGYEGRYGGASLCEAVGTVQEMAMKQAPDRGMDAPLSNEEIQAFAAEWYRKLDEHVPADEIVPMLAERDLEFHLPETVLRSRDDFRRWYAGGGDLPGVVNIFFDEQHVLSRVVASWLGDRARVAVVVNWQAHRWKPPTPRSEWIGFDAYQTWDMVRSAATGKPVIVRYVVDELRPMPGSPAL